MNKTSVNARRPLAHSGLLILIALALGGLLGLGTMLALEPGSQPAEAAGVPPESQHQPEMWSLAAPLSPTRHSLGAAASVAGDAYYAVGGTDQDGSPLGAVQRYELASNTWTTPTNLPQPLSLPGVANVGDWLHVVGGRRANGTPSNSHNAYLLSTQTWQSLAPYPAARSGIMVASWRGQLFAAGGLNANGSASDQAWRYDRIGDAWLPMNNMLRPAARAGVTAADGYVFMAGGIDGNTILKTFVRYDPLYDVWFQGPDLPEARVAPTVIAAGNYLYVFGGGGLAGNPDWPWITALRYEIDRYPLANWEVTDNFGLYPLVGSAGVCANSKLWVMGGYDIDGQVRNFNHYKDLEGEPCSPNRSPVRLPIVEALESPAGLLGGQWAGTTEHGDPFGFTFDLAHSLLVTDTLSGLFFLENCQSGGPVTVAFTAEVPVPVDPDTGSFSYGDGILRSIMGSFTSPTTAEGTYALRAILVPGHDFCGGSGSWQATWQNP
jgi:hypothetical protein